MSRKLRKRIIGAVVLAAFLVIFVPEWLDGAGHKLRHYKDVNIPAKPMFKPISDYVDNTPAPAENTGDKLKSSDQPKIHAWALQLGSFSNEANAEIMRDRFRAKGYASYVDVQKQKKKVIYRVRIGPELDRQRLEVIKAKLIKKEKIKSMIVKHP